MSEPSEVWKELKTFVKEKNTILLKEDFSCDMAEVYLNGNEVFTGNFWDYHRGCHGNILPLKYKWEGRNDLVNALEKYIQDMGKKVIVKEKQYKYNY